MVVHGSQGQDDVMPTTPIAGSSSTMAVTFSNSLMANSVEEVREMMQDVLKSAHKAWDLQVCLSEAASGALLSSAKDDVTPRLVALQGSVLAFSQKSGASAA